MSTNPMMDKLRKFRNRPQQTPILSHSSIPSSSYIPTNSFNSHLPTIDSLTRQLESKQNELQFYINQISRKEKDYSKQLQDIDQQYEQEFNRLHEMLREEVEKNKELEQRIKIIKALGIDENNSSDSSMLLADI